MVSTLSALWLGLSSRFLHNSKSLLTPQLTIISRDNNEFGSYDQQYGLQMVNRTNGEFTRSYKRSLFDFVDFFHQYIEGRRY
jgi:hypothetical protein